jgi:chorismate mutase
MSLSIQNKGRLDLKVIAEVLEGLEETIIFMLINRAQFAANGLVYEVDGIPFEGVTGVSLLEIRLRRHEEMDSEFGRFCVPEERPFVSLLPPPKRRVHLPPTGLQIRDFNVVNMTSDILAAYRALVPEICPPGDDGQYGSSVEHDVAALQAISRRVHFGAMYVAESKYQSDPARYDGLIAASARERLLAALTRADVEDRILARVADKVQHIQAAINPTVRRRVPPEAIMTFYRTHVIPLTKEGEIRYFLNRARYTPNGHQLREFR